jgi:cell division control protein 24
LQKYAQELSQSNTLDRDTIHLLFPNLNNVLNFQRRFLIRLEGIADIPWREQRWGLLFTDNVGKLISLLNATLMVTLLCAAWHCSLFVLWFVFLYGLLHLKQKEKEFAVYEPYCAYYTNASDVMLMEEQNLVVRLIFTH